MDLKEGCVCKRTRSQSTCAGNNSKIVHYINSGWQLLSVNCPCRLRQLGPRFCVSFSFLSCCCCNGKETKCFSQVISMPIYTGFSNKQEFIEHLLFTRHWAKHYSCRDENSDMGPATVPLYYYGRKKSNKG